MVGRERTEHLLSPAALLLSVAASNSVSQGILCMSVDSIVQGSRASVHAVLSM